MSKTFEEFKRFYQVTHKLIETGEIIETEIADLLKASYPATKDQFLSLRFASFPNSENILTLCSEFLQLSEFPEYQDIRSLTIEFTTRLIVLLRAFEDYQKVFTMFGYEPEIMQVQLIQGTMATALHNMQNTLSEYRALHFRKSWKLFGSITKFIPEVESTDKVGWWVFNREPKKPGDPTPAPYVHYEELPFDVLDSVYEFVRNHPAYELPDAYMYVLQENGISWSDAGMRDADITNLDDQCIFALIIGVTCAERFSDGTIKHFFHDGTMLCWLKRLAEMDSIN